MREITQETGSTRSLTSRELWEMWKDYRQQPGKRITAWQLRCWKSRANSQELEGKEAQQAERLARECGVESRIGKEAVNCSARGRLLSSTRTGFPLREDLVLCPGRWTTTLDGIQYPRELAVLVIVYGDLDDKEVSKGLENAPCIRAM